MRVVVWTHICAVKERTVAQRWGKVRASASRGVGLAGLGWAGPGWAGLCPVWLTLWQGSLVQAANGFSEGCTPVNREWESFHASSCWQQFIMGTSTSSVLSTHVEGAGVLRENCVRLMGRTTMMSSTALQTTILSLSNVIYSYFFKSLVIFWGN